MSNTNTSPNTERREGIKLIVLLIVMLAFGIGFVVYKTYGFAHNWSIVPHDRSAEAAAITAATQASIRESWMTRGKAAARALLKDPSSAQFTDLVLIPQEQPLNTYVLCGQVNGRNSFGAYSGARVFFAAGDLALLDDGTSHFRKLFDQFCVSRGRQDGKKG